MEQKYHWKLQDIFSSEEDYIDAKKQIYKKLEEIQKFQSKLNENSENIYECYQLYEQLLELYEKVYSFGMLSYHLDMSNQENIKKFKEVENIGTDLSKITSFITPEITNIDEKRLKDFLNENIKLKRYERILNEIIEKKKHILSEKEEQLLASFSEVFASSENTFDIFTNTEFKFGTLVDEDGKEVEMTESNYTKFLRNKNEQIRKKAFNMMYNKYKEFNNTITELYLSRVKEDTITSKVRKYNSSLEKAVLNDDSTIKVYNTLIESIHKYIGINHKFMELKKKMLNLEEMHLYDIYVNPFEADNKTISFEEAKQEVLDSLSILGNDYKEILEQAFENQWIDVYEKPNKRNGAYSMGVYGVHPFVLTNFINSKRDVSTIAHELGHAIHSYYSNNTQNVLDANYTIMVAEVASTVNEILLSSYQIEKENDKTKKAELIYEMLEMIRATLFRQSMFAEFEKIIHEKIEKNEMLSSENLNNIYYKLNKDYFGNSINVDENIQYEWSRIPHFYSCFYVYKYATGITAAIAIANKILKKEPGYINKYKEMLKQGCSKKSIDLLKMVDIDLESNKPYEEAIEFYEQNIKKLEELV